MEKDVFDWFVDAERDVEHAIKRSVVADVPQLRRGRVWCKTCQRTMKVNSATCMSNGWPKCCGHTMTIDSPDEQARHARANQ